MDHGRQPLRNVLLHPHVVGFKKHPVLHAEWLYIDIDPDAREIEIAGSPLLAYIIRRLWQFIPTLLGVVLLVFILFNWVGGDPAYLLAGKISNPEQIENIRRQLGVDQPYYVQLWIFIKQIVTGDFGVSWATNEKISNDPRHAPRPVADGARADARRSARCSQWRPRCSSPTCAAR